MDVHETLIDQFDDVETEDGLWAVAFELEEEGEWVSPPEFESPSSKMRLFASSADPLFGGDVEQRARQTLTQRLDALEEAIAAVRVHIDELRSNNPPRDAEDPPQLPNLEALSDAVTDLRAETAQSQPRIENIRQASLAISRWSRVWSWVLRRSDEAASAAFKTIGVGVAGFVMFQAPLLAGTLLERAGAVVEAAQAWIEAAHSSGGANTAATQRDATESQPTKSAAAKSRHTGRVSPNKHG